MRRAARTVGAAVGALGMAAQIGGAAVASGAEWPISSGVRDLDLLGGVVMYALGTLLFMGTIERVVRGRGRPGWWAWACLLGPVGLLPLLAEEAPEPVVGAAREPAFVLVDRVSGWLLTLGAAAFVLWAGAQWLARDAWPPALDDAERAANEARAVERLGTIAAAQEGYRQRDWDGDGRKTYAAFLAHLWRTIDGHSRPLDSGLLPRALAFAMGPSLAVDGYFYVDLNMRYRTGGPRQGEPLDLAREWAMAAVPARAGETGVHTFLRYTDGSLWRRDDRGAPPRFVPHDPAAEGWTALPSDDRKRGGSP